MDPDSVRWWRRYATPLIRLAFRPRLDGGENLPSGPYLLVGNHSGLGLAEILAIIVAWLARFGTSRPIAAMVHPISNNQPGSRKIRRLGAIPSTRPAAMAALAVGVPVMVLPGGDHEAQRPIWQFNQVQFASRKGFLKIARDARVPIVPMGIRGSHFTAPVLWRSDRWLAWLLILPKLMGMRRFPLTLLGVIGVAVLALLGPIWNWWLTAGLAWLWLALPLSQLPWVPWSIRMRIGQPIAASELFPDDSDAAIDAAYGRVQGEVQALVTSSRSGRDPRSAAPPRRARSSPHPG
jgi:hypothetical protein